MDLTFENLQLKEFKALQEAELKRLEKINVICGRNNSGKSTVLEAIEKEEFRNHTKSFEGSHRERLAQRILKGLREEGVNYSEEGANSFRLAIQEIVSGEEWTPKQEDRNRFTASLTSYRQYPDRFKHTNLSDVLHDRSQGEHAIIEAYAGSFQSNPQISLLPPTRSLELTERFGNKLTATPDGSGVLSELFMAKNRSDTERRRKAYEEMKKGFEEITRGYSLDITVDGNDQKRLKFRKNTEEWINAADCGTGLQEVLHILFFALDVGNRQNDVILIEEPESHIHPHMQKRLLSFLKEETDKQYFLTTHSNVFLSSAYADRVYFTSFDGEQVEVDDATSRASMLHDLGYSVADNLVADLVILVEGVYDTPVIEEFLRKKGIFDHYDIKTWPLGGDQMSSVDLSVFAPYFNIIALLDRDPQSESARAQFEEKCEVHNIDLRRLDRYAIENYFTAEAIREAWPHCQAWKDPTEINPDEKVEDQVGFDLKSRNREIAESMELEEIEDTDLFDFFEQVEEMCRDAEK